MSSIQIVLLNDLDCEIYRSDPVEITETMEITEVLIKALREDCIELSPGDQIKIEDVLSDDLDLNTNSDGHDI